MDILKLVLKEVPFEGKQIVTFIINGQDIIDLVRKIELPFAKEENSSSIAGAYEGLSPHDILYPSKHLLGKPKPLFKSKGKTQILLCNSCHEPGCWPLFAKIKVTRDAIIWSDFEQPHRKKWDYSKLGPFTFSRKRYEKELHKPTHYS